MIADMLTPALPVVAGKVATAAGASINAGIWTLVGVVVTAFCSVAIALIRQAAPLRKGVSEDRAADFERLRVEINGIKEEAQRASKAAQRLENMVACMRPAISILTAEVKRLDPNASANPALIQVQELMAMAAVGDFGVGMAMTGLATMRGTKE